MRGGIIALALSVCILFTGCAACAPQRPEIDIVSLEIVKGQENPYTVKYTVFGVPAEKSFLTFEDADKYVMYLIELGGRNKSLPRLP